MDHDEWFSAFYRAHYEAVLRYALRRTDRETAHDVVSETFLVAWRRRAAVPVDPGQQAPWLFGVARLSLANAERSANRAQRVTARLGQQRGDHQVPDPTGAVAEQHRLRQALATLSGADQEALRLIGWEELDLAAAALAMGCPKSVMAVRLYRARRRLERALDAGLPGAPRSAPGTRPGSDERRRPSAGSLATPLRGQSGDAMRIGTSTVVRVRSIMAPANPAPGTAAADRWDGERGLETRQAILMLAAADEDSVASPADGQPVPGGRSWHGQSRPRQSRRRRAAWRIVAPVTAGLTVAGLVLGLPVTGGSPGQGTAAALVIPGELDAVVSLSPSNAWAVGQSAGRTLIAHWNGQSWSRVPSPSA